MYGTVRLDGDEVIAHLDEEDEYTITVSFPAEDGVYAPGVSGWCNSVGIRIREDAGIQVWVSVADPRGGLQMEVWPDDKGNLLLSVPHESDGMPHGDGLKSINDGFYRILGASVPDDPDEDEDEDE